MKRTPFENLYPKLSQEDKNSYVALLHSVGVVVPRQNKLLMGETSLNVILKRQEELLAKYAEDPFTIFKKMIRK